MSCGFCRPPGTDVVVLTPEESKYGAVETREESRRCAELFRKNRDRINGIIVTLPNFGEEAGYRGHAALADLRVPVLVQATPDDRNKMGIANRRDSFCGKMSACNNLKQYGIPIHLRPCIRRRLISANSEGPGVVCAVCRVVKGFRNIRVVR